MPEMNVSSIFPVTLPATLSALCLVGQSSPAPTVVWYIGEEEQMSGVETEVELVGWRNRTISRLQTPFQRRMDGQALRCVASNSHRHRVASREIQIKLRFGAEIVSVQNAYPLDREAAVIQCLAYGSPRANVSWFTQQGHPVDLTDDNIILKNDELDLRRVSSSLIFTEVRPKDFGQYKCVARNGIVGTAAAAASELVNITKAVEPQRPHSLGVIDITPISVNISWQHPRNQRPLQMAWYQVGYRSSLSFESLSGVGQVGVTSFIEDKIWTNQNHYTIYGLKPGVEYTIMVRTCNRVGCSPTEDMQLRMPSSESVGAVSARQDGASREQMTILEVILLLIIGCLTIALTYLLAMLMLSIRKIRQLHGKTTSSCRSNDAFQDYSRPFISADTSLLRDYRHSGNIL